MIINFDSLSVFIVSSFSCVFPYILLLILLYCLPSLQWSLGWLVLLYFPCIFKSKKKKQQQTNGKIVFMMIVIIAGLLKCIASTLFSGILISGAVLVYFFFHSRQEWEREKNDRNRSSTDTLQSQRLLLKRRMLTCWSQCSQHQSLMTMALVQCYISLVSL